MPARTSLTGVSISSGYPQLLHVADTDGLTSTPTQIYDGNGTASVMWASTAEMRFGGASDYTELQSDGDVLFVGGGGLVHGCISRISNSGEISITSQNTFVQVTEFDTNEPSNNTTPDHTNDHITILVAGTYDIDCTITLNSTSGAGSTAEAEIQKNNGNARVGAAHVDRTFAGGGSESGSVTMLGRAALAVNDTIEVWLKNETNTQNYIVEDIVLKILMVGG